MMRLQRLGLELFGHFTNKWLDFGDKPKGSADFHLIYGPNEAGKTTVMEGYLRLLYRFQHKEPYDFKHKRPNLKVSATLLLDDKIQEFTRLSGRNSNLVDQAGTPLAEATLQSALSGLLIDDYRNLFCLDDTTIEKGGDEIANSKGDIGRLLFSAAAGVSDLSEVLDTVDERSANLFKKGGSKSDFAQLKRSLDDVTKQIGETDISVAMYRQQKQALDASEEIEKIVREQRKNKLDAQARLKAIAKALPMFAKIKELERELEPLEHFPINQDIDPEELIGLSKRRILLEASRERLKSLIDNKTIARDAITSQPDMVQTLKRLEDQRNLRARCGTAATDLPRRLNQRDDVIKDMKRSLVDIGINNVTAPDQFVFGSAYLQELERKFQVVSEAEAVLGAARDEEENALEGLNTAEKAIEGLPTVSEDDSNLQNILDLRNASHIFAEANRVKEALRLAQRSAREALSLLSLDGQIFETAPELQLSSDEASTLARNIESAKIAITNAEDELGEADGVADQLGSKIDMLEDSGMIITDEEAGVSRNERDRLWREHLGDLSRPSAKSFESAMQLDDTKNAARHSQAKELAEVRQLKVALAEAGRKSEAKKSAFKKASERLNIFQSQLQEHLSISGLKSNLSAAGFADWVRKVETARTQKIVEENEQFAATSFLEEAELLRKELAGVLNAPNEKLDTLISLASKTAVMCEKKLADLRLAQKILNDAKTEHQKRTTKASKAAEIRDGLKLSWSTALDEAFGDLGPNIPFPHAFKTFREMPKLNEKRLGLCHQIESMETDQKALDDALKQLIVNAPELNSISTIDAYDALVSKAEAAARADAMRTELFDEIDNAQEKLQSTQDELKDIDSQVRLLARIFDTNIPTQTVDELRQAVLQGNRAIELRTQVGSLSNDLCSVLGVHSRTETEEALQGQSLPMVEASLSEIERDLSGFESELTRSIEERARAEADLNAIRGDADVAELVARRQTIELEMESVILNYLELRIGHMLADTAIQRYRNTHRSGMMETAESAFTELTNGAYSGLTTQIDGAKEILLAIQASDGAAKQAQALSKGTRFQLYLALRAAAYEQMAANGTILPFFCDDVFETFDEDRTRAACGLMRRIGQTGQAIYLTHHKHVVNIAQEVCGEDVRVHEI